MKKLNFASFLLITSILLLTACQSTGPVYEDYYVYSAASEGQIEPEIQSVAAICTAQAAIAARKAYDTSLSFGMTSIPQYLPPIADSVTGFVASGDPGRSQAIASNVRTAGFRAREERKEVTEQCMAEQGFEVVAICVSNCSDSEEEPSDEADI